MGSRALAPNTATNVRAGALPQINGSFGFTRTFQSQFSGGGSFEIPDSLKFEPDSLASISDRLRYLEDRAPNRVELDTFDRLMTAYRIDATTWTGRVALVRALDDRSAAILSYDYRHTTRGPLRFPDHVLTLALVYQF